MAGVVWMCFLFRFFLSLRTNAGVGPGGSRLHKVPLKWHGSSQRHRLYLARKISSSSGWLDVTLSKQRPLGGVINFMWSEVGGLVLFLFVHSNLYIVIYVNGMNSWMVLPTPFPALPDVCAGIRGCGCRCGEKPPLQMGKFAQ